MINYTVVTPVPYPGQKATEPFARVQIALDAPGGSVQLQDLIEVPVDDVRVGMRVAGGVAPARPSATKTARGGGWGVGGGLEGWIPTGEPDADPSTLPGGVAVMVDVAIVGHRADADAAPGRRVARCTWSST